MNTTGFIRGYMSKNMSAEDFIEVVAETFIREFEEDQVELKTGKNGFKILINDFSIEMNKKLIETLKSPYGVDRYILEEFEKQGFDLDRNRSQYIQYCFGNYGDAEVISIF